jgi:hypothetical protein
VESETGTVVEERFHPRDAFAGHDVATPWDRLQLAYFTGFAMWIYLSEPYKLTDPGFTARAIDP